MLIAATTAFGRCVEIFLGFHTVPKAVRQLAFSSDALPGCCLYLNLWIVWECAILYLIFSTCLGAVELFFPSNDQWSHWAYYYGRGYFFCLFYKLSTIHTLQLMGNDSVRLIYSLVHEVLFPQERNCRIMWFSLRMGLFLMDDIHFSAWIVSVLNRPVEFI